MDAAQHAAKIRELDNAMHRTTTSMIELQTIDPGWVSGVVQARFAEMAVEAQRHWQALAAILKCPVTPAGRWKAIYGQPTMIGATGTNADENDAAPHDNGAVAAEASNAAPLQPARAQPDAVITGDSLQTAIIVPFPSHLSAAAGPASASAVGAASAPSNATPAPVSAPVAKTSRAVPSAAATARFSNAEVAQSPAPAAISDLGAANATGTIAASAPVDAPASIPAAAANVASSPTAADHISADVHLTAAQMVFQLPELVSLILEHIQLSGTYAYTREGSSFVYKVTPRAFDARLARLNKACYASAIPSIYKDIHLGGKAWPSPVKSDNNRYVGYTDARIQPVLIHALLSRSELGQNVRHCKLLINSKSVLTAHSLLCALSKLEYLSLLFDGPALSDCVAAVRKLASSSGVLQKLRSLRSLTVKTVQGVKWQYQGLPAHEICEYLPHFLGRPHRPIEFIHQTLPKSSLQACCALFRDMLHSLSYERLEIYDSHPLSSREWIALLAKIPNIVDLLVTDPVGPVRECASIILAALHTAKPPLQDFALNLPIKNVTTIWMYELLSNPTFLPHLSSSARHIQDIRDGKVDAIMQTPEQLETLRRVMQRWE